MKKLSYAKIAKKLASKEKKYTSLLDKANNSVEANTAQRMLDRINQRKQGLASENQMRADQINNKSFAYGGSTKKKKVYAPGGATNNVPPLNPSDPYSVWWHENYGDLPANEQPIYEKGTARGGKKIPWTDKDGNKRYGKGFIVNGKYMPSMGSNYISPSETSAQYSMVGNNKPPYDISTPYGAWYNQNYGHLPDSKRPYYDTGSSRGIDKDGYERYGAGYIVNGKYYPENPNPNHVPLTEAMSFRGQKPLISEYNPLTRTMGTVSDQVFKDIESANLPPLVSNSEGKGSSLIINPLTGEPGTVSGQAFKDVAGMNFPPQIPQGDVDPATLSPEAAAELGLTEPTVKGSSGKGSSSAKKGYDNSNVMGFLENNKDYLNYLREQGLRPTAENIRKLQEFVGTEADNKGGKNTMAALQSNYDQWYKQAKAQGATDQEAAAVAQSQVETLDTIGFNPLDNKANFDPSFQDKTMSAVGMAGNFVDNAARFRQIRNTQKPIAPAFAEAPMLETRYNISPQLNEMRSAQAAYNRGVDQSALSGGQGMNAKAAAYSARINAANRLYGEKSNREQALRNRQRTMSADVKNRNNQMYSAYRNQLVDFDNARQGAIAQNTANFGQDMSSIGSDYMKNVRAPKMQLEAWKPYLNRVGVMDRNYNIYGNQNS